jgi:hypothetical protein
MMSYDYAFEKLTDALSYAVGSSASVQERLAGAYSSGVYLLRDEHVPDGDLRARLRELEKAMTRVHDSRGSFFASAEAMSNDEAAKWLREMFSIYAVVVENGILA